MAHQQSSFFVKPQEYRTSKVVVAMARLLLPLLTSLAFLSTLSLAQTWYDLTYLPPNVTSFSGAMHIPPLPHAGTYYLWYGLQPTDNSGVYQGVLDGRSGSWRIAPGWCCQNPSTSSISTSII